MLLQRSVQLCFWENTNIWLGQTLSYSHTHLYILPIVTSSFVWILKLASAPYSVVNAVNVSSATYYSTNKTFSRYSWFVACGSFCLNTLASYVGRYVRYCVDVLVDFPVFLKSKQINETTAGSLEKSIFLSCGVVFSEWMRIQQKIFIYMYVCMFKQNKTKKKLIRKKSMVVCEWGKFYIADWFN